MVVNDPIADMLTRIRNAHIAKHDTVTIPSSKAKKAIAKILLDEGYIRNYELVNDDGHMKIKLTLKYINGKQQPVIVGLNVSASPGCASMRAVRNCLKYLAAWALPSCPHPRA